MVMTGYRAKYIFGCKGKRSRSQGHKMQNAHSAISVLFIIRSYAKLANQYALTRERPDTNIGDLG